MKLRGRGKGGQKGVPEGRGTEGRKNIIFGWGIKMKDNMEEGKTDL